MISSTRRALVSFLLILSFGSFLRFYGLDNQSLWNDELSSWKRSNYNSIADVIEKGVYPDVHPPGYEIMLFFIKKYIGDSELTLRLPSAVAGALSILFIFLVGVKLYTYKEGFIASALMAFSWCPIYYSQEARSYSLLLLFTLISTYFWITLLTDLQSKNFNRKYIANCFAIIGYIISAITACYLHYFGLLLVVLQGVGAAIYFLNRKKMLLSIVLIYILILLAYLPWIPVFWYHLNKGPVYIESPDYTAIFSYLKFCFNDSIVILCCILPFYLFYFANSINRLRLDKECKSNFSSFNPTLLALLWLIIPFAIAYIKSIISTPVFTNRNLIISLPAVYLLLARSITTLPLRAINKHVISVGLVALLISHIVFVKQYYSTPQKQQFREAVKYIVEYRNIPQDNSMVVGYAWSAKYFNYYFDKSHSTRTIDMLAGQKKDIPILLKMIDEKAPQYIWFISAHRVPEKEFLNFLNSKFNLVDSKKFKQANVWLFGNLNLENT